MVYDGRLLILVFLTFLQSLEQLHDDPIWLWLWFGHHQLHLAALDVAHLWVKNPQNGIYPTNFNTLPFKASSRYTSRNFLAAFFPLWNTQKTVSSNQRKNSLIYGQRKNFFALKKVLLIQIMFFNVNKSISLDLRTFFWINKTFFNSKKFFHCPYITDIFLWFKETVFSVKWISKIWRICSFLHFILKLMPN